MKNRRIYISLPNAYNAVKFSKENCELDCLAFSVMIKMKYVNSSIKNPTYRNLKGIFHIGQNKLKAILSYGIENGYFHYDKHGWLVSDKIRIKKTYRINLDFDKSDFKLNEIKDKIRELVFVNQIKLQRDRNFRFQHRGEPFRPKKSNNGSFKQQRQKRLTSISSVTGMSLTSITKIMNVSRSKARKIKNQSVSDGLVMRKFESVKTCISPNDFKRTANAWFKNSGFNGYLYHGKDGIYCQVSNVYSIRYEIVRIRHT